MGYQLGIDLGTTYTAAAVCRSSGRGWAEPEVISLGSRSATVASVLFLAADGAVLVGEAAERRALTDPDRVVREFKRRIGDPTPIVVAGRNWAPEELSARLVRWVLDRVAEREGGPADRIAVTHPASWGSHKKDLLTRALAAQGLSVTFLAEPQAAALHYASTERVVAGSTIAVYDLGGGTFDAAVVRKGDAGSAGSGPAGFGLLGRPQGLERLGGVDFDEVVFEHVRAGLPEAFDNLDDTDPAVLSAVSRIRRDCTEAKEALSSDTEVSIPVLLPNSRGSVRLHRSEFEQLIRPQVEQTVDALRQAVTSAGLAPDQLTAVLLVGGSSRIPLVAQLVSEQLGRPVAVDADPKNAIAKGAALAVSPQPTTSWPAAAVPPVGSPTDPGRGRTGGRADGGRHGAGAIGAGAIGAAGVAGAAAAMGAAGPAGTGPLGAVGAGMAGGGLAGPPTRPPLPGSGPPPDFGRPADRQRPGPASPPDSGPPTAPRRPAGPTHESAGSLLSGGGGNPPVEQSWAPAPDRSWEGDPQPDWDPQPDPYSSQDWDQPRRHRSIALYVGIAGLAAVALIALVLLYWPDSSTRFGVNTGNSPEESSVVTTEEDAPSTRTAPARPNSAKPADPESPDRQSTSATRPGRTTEPSESSAVEPTVPTTEPPSSPVVEPPPPVDTTQGQSAPDAGPPGGAADPAAESVPPA